MKTQISRDTFHSEQRYSGVYLQQGRMILDADWNELSEIEKARLVAALRDAISGTNKTGAAVAGGAPRVGGLKVYADPAGSSSIRIQPGTLYVEGVAACLDAATPLAIDAQPDYPVRTGYSGQSQRLYADVWERTVTALEQSDLMDAGLHGADTATRTQTMLQVKWCGDTATEDPLDEGFNPSIGTAPLTLKLRSIRSGSDTCDPCASQVNVDERLGNYLFRVEVHDYVAATRRLTLKWSRDNGSEACSTDAIPSGFASGDWVWEFFDDDTERLLGNHLATSATKLRGLIKTTCVTPTDASQPSAYVRQWDGYLTIDLDDGTLTGIDRGVALYSGTVDDVAPGRVVLGADGVLQINLELMELALACQAARFVPGDYWQAVVREAVHSSGQYVLPAMDDMSVPSVGEPPRGVRHHYLYLGALNISRKLVAQDDAFSRRMAFPPLTDITAGDVGFTDTCVGLFNGAKNVQQALSNLCAIAADDIAFTDHCAKLFSGAHTVQQALDSLCAIAADDIAYPLPTCATGNSVEHFLLSALDPDGNHQLDVKTALDALLCQLSAASLPYQVPACATSPNLRERLGLAAGDNNVADVLDKMLCGVSADTVSLRQDGSALYSEVLATGSVTIQQALTLLFGRVGGGCAVVATSPGHLQTLLQQFAASSTASDLWICLKAGSYPLTSVAAISGKRSLRISGEGPESVTITCSAAALTFAADEVILENLSLTFSSGVGQLAISADTTQVSGCHFSRTAASANGPAMISVGGPGGAVCRMAWRDNSLYAQVKTVSGTGIQWAGASVVGEATLSEALLGLSQESLLGDKAAYDAAMNRVVKQVMAMTPDKRLAWKTNLEKVATTKVRGTRAAALMQVAVANTVSMNEALAQTQPGYSETLAAVEGLLANWVSYSPDYALQLANHKVGGVITGNRVEGWLLFANGVSGYSNPASIAGVSLTGTLVNSGGEDLQIIGNSFAALKANLPSTALNASKVLVAKINGHARLTLSGNRIDTIGNAVTAINLMAQGNTWAGIGELGYALADRAVASGNLVESSGTIRSAIRVATNANQLAASGNLMLDVTPMR